jgi:FAD/FMN-containing dehydrogenase/Fe-S oxidoreductase
VDSFAQATELERELRQAVRGEVRFDAGSRAMYASDASNYRQIPIGLVVPRDAEDVIAAVAACRKFGAPILPRGAGTSLAGQSCSVAVVLDFTKYMNGILALDPGVRVARVQPGVVLDTLRSRAEQHHFTFAPDPSTHNRCTIGGMIGNNSCGTHSLLGGKTVDNVEELDVVLYDGTRLKVGATTEAELEAIVREGGRRGEIYGRLRGIRDQYAELVRARFPRIPRRVSGYNLDELLPENGFHVARALVGTEGTCATIVSATLNLASSPPFRVLTALAFPDAFVAADAVPMALEHGPIGLEGFDGLLVDFMRRKHLAVDDVALLPPGGGFLLVEMGAWNGEEARQKAEALVQSARGWPVKPGARIYNAAEAARVWTVRESALGATVFVPGEPEGWEGWEDAGVPPQRLGEYLRGIAALMSQYGYRSAMYGHFGQGCVHMRINFDFRSEKGLRDFREFIDRAADLVLRLGGSLSGEHGDGQARGALLPKMFGPELMRAFGEFKALWDPHNRMNPGKVVDAVRVYDPLENLRHHSPWDQPPSAGPRQEKGAGAGSTAQSNGHAELKTHFVFAKEEGSLERATERCVGVGACRKASGGVMCPSYRATGDEQHSTRGRARLLWEMLAGDLRREGFQSTVVHEALDLCLSCKACKTECPVQVDMAAYKAEFLAQHYKGRVHPLRHYIFGFADKLARWGSLTPGLTNAILTGPVTSSLIKHVAGVAQERALPRLAKRSYVRGREAGSSAAANPASHPSGKSAERMGHGDMGRAQSRRVLLWPDTWNNYYHPQTLAAAETVLSEAGFEVITPEGHICCGRPLYDFGHLGAARAYLGDVLDRMAAHIEAGVPFIFLEPSCASVFKDELPELFPNDGRAKRLREQVWLLADWLAAKAPEFATGRLNGAHILVHGHCHHKAVFGGAKSEIALLRQAGATVEAIEAGCCGMAGPFGFEAEKFAVSKTIAGQGLLPAVEAAGPMTIVVADGFSCREQIMQLGHRRALHFAEVVAHSCGCGG